MSGAGSGTSSSATLGFGQSDTKRREKAAASVAFAAAKNDGRFTRFSSSGGGQLPGFDTPADPDSKRYGIEQWMNELAYQHRGFSFQGEYHYKEVDDRVTAVVSELDGYYVQAGYFFHESFEKFPKPLEFAIRTARVDSDAGIEVPADRELTFGANWFFAGHDNKLTIDATKLKSTLPGGTADDGWRARLQWDITF